MTHFKEQYRSLFHFDDDHPVRVFESAGALYGALDRGDLDLDAVIIATPHESHQEIAFKAFERGIHVLCDKPTGVFTRQARNMNEAAERNNCVFGSIFNQRALPINQKIHEIIQSGKYGALKRISWTVTDWYRPDDRNTGAGQQQEAAFEKEFEHYLCEKRNPVQKA